MGLRIRGARATASLVAAIAPVIAVQFACARQSEPEKIIAWTK